MRDTEPSGCVVRDRSCSTELPRTIGSAHFRVVIEQTFDYHVTMILTRPDDALAVLDRAVDAVDGDGCTEILVAARQVRGWLDAIEARVSTRLGELHDAAGGAPASDVHTRCGGVSAAEGKRKQRRSETIDDAPSFGCALAAGRIGAEHVDALASATVKLDDDVKSALLDCEDDLLADAERLTPEKFGRSVRDLARRLELDHGIERNRQQRRETFLSRRLNPATGMTEGRFAFHPELANQVFGAIDKEVAAMIKQGAQAGDLDCVDRTVDRNRLAAHAFGRLIASGHDRVRPLEADITVLVDADTLASAELHDASICETAEGAALPPASIRRLMCEGRVTPIIVGADGVALDAGRTIRHANRAQRRALRSMYRCCAFGECDTVFDRCEIHHILPWELGGSTDLINLVPLCSKHHHVVHDGGWHLELLPDRMLVIRRRDGTEFGRWRPDVADQRTTSPTRRRRRPAA